MASSGWFYRVRVGTLSLVLALVCLWACQDVRARRARNEWQAPLRVGLVIVQRGDVSTTALSELQARVAVLEERLASEFARYHSAPRERMIELVPYGPVRVEEPPPAEPEESWASRVQHAFELWRYTRAVDRAAGVPTRALDSRIYVVAEKPNSASVSSVAGFSESRGRVGVARVELDAQTVDLALFVAAHELFHTLGATDKYDADGRTSMPVGLPEPDAVPRFPQRYTEVMARQRVLSETHEVPLECLSELRVGRWTAAEIGWTQ